MPPPQPPLQLPHWLQSPQELQLDDPQRIRFNSPTLGVSQAPVSHPLSHALQVDPQPPRTWCRRQPVMVLVMARTANSPIKRCIFGILSKHKGFSHARTLRPIGRNTRQPFLRSATAARCVQSVQTNRFGPCVAHQTRRKTPSLNRGGPADGPRHAWSVYRRQARVGKWRRIQPERDGGLCTGR